MESYNFKIRTCEAEWQLLDSIIRQGNRLYRKERFPYRDWLNGRLQHFCLHVAPHILATQEDSVAVEKHILLLDTEFLNSSSVLRILDMIATKKKKTIAQIIQKYIVDFPMVNEEFERARIEKGLAIKDFYRNISSFTE